MSTLEKTELNIGYIPLLDCVAILWAEKQGYFAEQGLTINLIREASWSSLRDRLAYGFLDAAHSLSAMLPRCCPGHRPVTGGFTNPSSTECESGFY